MDSPAGKAAAVLGAIAVAVVLFVVLVGGSDEDEPAQAPGVEATATETTGAGTGDGEVPKPGEPKPEKPEVAVIEVEGGEPVGGVRELEFEKGEAIRFTVRSDVADHLHLHGYDVFQEIAAGGEARFDLPATIEGVFEVELEDRVVPVAEITVNP